MYIYIYIYIHTLGRHSRARGGERRRGGLKWWAFFYSSSCIIYPHSLIVAADAVDEINRLLKIIFLDLQRNDQIVRENVLSCIIIYTPDLFYRWTPLSTQKLQKKRRWTNSNSYSGQLFKLFNDVAYIPFHFAKMITHYNLFFRYNYVHDL